MQSYYLAHMDSCYFDLCYGQKIILILINLASIIQLFMHSSFSTTPSSTMLLPKNPTQISTILRRNQSIKISRLTIDLSILCLACMLLAVYEMVNPACSYDRNHLQILLNSTHLLALELFDYLLSKFFIFISDSKVYDPLKVVKHLIFCKELPLNRLHLRKLLYSL